MPPTHNGSYKAAGKPIEVPPCALPGGRAQLPAEMLQPSIRAAFSGADVFVTGGTGFVGSVMIEQLLRLVPEAGEGTRAPRKGRRGSSNSLHQSPEARQPEPAAARRGSYHHGKGRTGTDRSAPAQTAHARS